MGYGQWIIAPCMRCGALDTFEPESLGSPRTQICDECWDKTANWDQLWFEIEPIYQFAEEYNPYGE